MTDYFELGVKLAFDLAGFSKDAGLKDFFKALFKKKPPVRGSFAEFSTRYKVPRSRLATDVPAYARHRAGIARAQRAGA